MLFCIGLTVVMPKVWPSELPKELLVKGPPLWGVRVQGLVRFSAIIGKDARIQNLQLVSGHHLLASAVFEAVRQWVYELTLLNGEPVEVLTQVDVNFTLTPIGQPRRSFPPLESRRPVPGLVLLFLCLINFVKKSNIFNKKALA
jgi:hypothetical protein